MKLNDLAQITQILRLPEIKGVVKGFSIDSRLIKEKEVYFALKGERSDGHSFLKDVASKGASAAVVAKDYQGEDFGLTLFKVEDPLETLQMLAKEVMKKRKTRIAAVTGSVGKTTTKEFIATLLGEKFKVAKSPGNANSQVGVPLTILNSDGEEEILVLEMGMSAPSEIKRLVDIAPPEVAIITKVSLAHSEFFADGLEGIAAAKAEIFSNAKTRLGWVNFSACRFEEVAKSGSCEKRSYGLGKGDCILVKQEGFFIEERGLKSPKFSLPFEASQLCENFLGAACVARSFGMEWEEIFLAAKSLKPFMRRFERVEKDGVVFINDSYNANPESMTAALNNLPKPTQGARTIAVLGEMKELGRFSEEGHVAIGELALKKVDHLLCLGKGCLPMVDIFNRAKMPVDHFLDFETLKKALYQVIKEGDVVLLKGSNSNGLWRILEP